MEFESNIVLSSKEKLGDNGRKLVDELVERLFEDGVVDFLSFYGYTASFNDGDPPLPRSYFYHTVGEVIDEENFDVLPEHFAEPLADATYTDDDDIIKDACKKLGLWYGYKELHSDDRKVLDMIEGIVKSLYNTNYYVTFFKEGGKIVRYDGEYDCGY